MDDKKCDQKFMKNSRLEITLKGETVVTVDELAERKYNQEEEGTVRGQGKETITRELRTQGGSQEYDTATKE